MFVSLAKLEYFVGKPRSKSKPLPKNITTFDTIVFAIYNIKLVTDTSIGIKGTKLDELILGMTRHVDDHGIGILLLDVLQLFSL